MTATARPETGRTRRRALMLSGHHWTSPVHLSAHHLAKFLVRNGWDVAFLSTPTSLFHRLRFGSAGPHGARFANWRAGGGRSLDGHLFQYTPLALLPPSRLPVLSGPFLFRHWPALSLPPVRRVLAAHGFDRLDLMIADTVLAAPLADRLKPTRLVYRVTDRNADYPGAPRHLVQAERDLAARAHAVICTGDALIDYARAMSGREPICIANGVDIDHFAIPQPEPEDLQAIPGPRALYVGTLATWFDWSLLSQAATRRPAISFIVIGPTEHGEAPGGLPANVHVLGPRPYAQVPGYMQHCDLGLIPFRGHGKDPFVDAINPLKLYEYMAAGLPVVTTPFAQVKALASPAELAATPDDFAAAIDRSLDRDDGYGAERAFAARHSWDRQFAPLLGKVI